MPPLDSFLVEKREYLEAIFQCEVRGVQKLNSLLRTRLKELTVYTRPGVYGDRRCMRDIKSESPLDRADGPETREGLICDVVRLGSKANGRPNVRELANSMVSLYFLNYSSEAGFLA